MTNITAALKLNYQRLSSYRLLSLRKLFLVWEQLHLKRLLTFYSVDCVFDVGANHGQYAQMLRRKMKYTGYIISFEPNPEAVEILRRESAGDPKWIIENSALADHDGEDTFNVMVHSEFSSLSAPRHDEVDQFRFMNRVKVAVNVRTETLETAFNRLKRTYGFTKPFLKLDTQGFDVDIVKSGRAVIHEFIGMQSELAVKKLYENAVDFREAITVYEKCGFSLSAFVPNNAGHFPRLIEIDCIMIRTDLLESAESKDVMTQ